MADETSKQRRQEEQARKRALRSQYPKDMGFFPCADSLSLAINHVHRIRLRPRRPRGADGPEPYSLASSSASGSDTTWSHINQAPRARHTVLSITPVLIPTLHDVSRTLNPCDHLMRPKLVDESPIVKTMTTSSTSVSR